MNTHRLFAFSALLSLAPLAVACGSGRDVDVTGKVDTADLGKGAVRVEFYEITKDGEKATYELADSVVADDPAHIDHTVAIDGDELLIRAIFDANDNEACDAGEAWGEVTVKIDEKDQATFEALSLAKKPCGESLAEAKDEEASEEK